MSWLVRYGFGLLACCLSPSLLAQVTSAQNEGLQWLQKVSAASQKLNYSGTFVYRNGSRSETSRIVHYSGNGSQIEKVEVLDGSPREVFRHNDQVSCFLPESRLVIIEQRSVRRSFPALLPGSLAGLNEHYSIRKAGNARVAGFESQIVRLEPRDAWRYGHQLWVDTGSGLLLKADVFSDAGEALESMAFTELRIGETIRPETLKPSFATTKENWQVRQAKLRDLRDDTPWVFRTDLPGFRKQAALLRSIGKDGEDLHMMHWVFSDGLVALSVFVSPLRSSEAGEESFNTIGALSVMKRVLEAHQIVVMGDLPPAAIKHFAEGIGVRGK
jgi:sigma-E factor negative regulatory protein RseB